jgi:hypothetical protein
MILLLISYIFIVFAVKRVIDKRSFFELFALSVLLMAGISGFIPFVANEYFEIGYQNAPQLLFCVTAFLNALVYLTVKPEKLPIKTKRVDKFSFAVLFIVIMLLIRGMVLPMRGWDAYSLYDARALVFAGGGDLKSMKSFSEYDEFNQLYYFSYPPLTSVLHTLLYVNNIDRVMFLYALFYSVFIVYIYLFVSRLKINKTLALMVFVIAAFNPMIMAHTKLAYTNLPTFTFQLAALYYLIEFSKTSRNKEAVISALLISCSNWTRSLEPIFITFFAAFIFIVVKNKGNIFQKGLKIVSYISISMVTAIIWKVYIKNTIGSLGETSPGLMHLVGAMVNSLPLSNLLDILFFLYTALYPVILYVILGVIIIFYYFAKSFKKITDAEIIILIIIALTNLLMIAGTLYFSVTFTWWDKIPDSYLRSNFIVVPLISILAGQVLESVNTKQ